MKDVESLIEETKKVMAGVDSSNEATDYDDEDDNGNGDKED